MSERAKASCILQIQKAVTTFIVVYMNLKYEWTTRWLRENPKKLTAFLSVCLCASHNLCVVSVVLRKSRNVKSGRLFSKPFSLRHMFLLWFSSQTFSWYTAKCPLVHTRMEFISVHSFSLEPINRPRKSRCCKITKQAF